MSTKHQEAVERYLAGERIVDIEASLGVRRQTIYNQLRDRGITPARARGRQRRVVRLDDDLDPTSIDGLLQKIVVLQQRVLALEEAMTMISGVVAKAMPTPS